MIKLLFVYRYLTYGGVETVIRARIQQLTKHRVEPWAWFLQDGPGRDMFINDMNRILIGDSQSIRLKIRDVGFSAATTFDTPEVIPLLSKYSVPIIVEAHSPYYENLAYLKDLDAGSVAAVFTPSRHQQAVVSSELAEPIPVHVIQNSIGVEYFHEPLAQNHTIRHPILGWVGRMDALKNWKGFLEVGRLVIRQAADIELMMVGDFPSRGGWYELYHQARKRHVLPRLRWYKSLHPNIMPNFFDLVSQSGGVLLSTSKGDSFGMSVAEAMVRGCAVIAPKEPPFTEFVQNGVTGLLYSSGDYAGAARLTEFLILNKHKQQEIGAKARRSIRSDYSPSKTSEAFLSAISEYCQLAERSSDKSLN